VSGKLGFFSEAVETRVFSLPNVSPIAPFFFAARGGPASSFSSRFALAIAACETTSFRGAFRFAPVDLIGRAFLLAEFLLAAVLREPLDLLPLFALLGDFAMGGNMNPD
jgi:hypothetical protein